MSKPTIAVAFKAGVPLAGFEFLMKRFVLPDAEPVSYIDCSSVDATDYGFLRLVPKVAKGESTPVLIVPREYIVWMIEGNSRSEIGFLTGEG
ncbi:MAG: hypothetical protein JWM47_4142 [Acidimicrobiales bacterium]|nr:hypothetical protein [Acidimicrobiales bacterium]